MANSLLHFSFFRFWLGTGECGNFSGGNKVVAQWFPVRERAFAVGIFNSASMIGSAVAPFLIVPLMHWYGWRVAFLVPSLLGMVWAGVWWFFYRTPEEHKGLSAGRGRLHPRRRLRSSTEPAPTNAQLLRLGPTWGLDALPPARGPGGAVLHLLDARVPLSGARVQPDGDRVLRLGPLPLRRSREHRRRLGVRVTSSSAASPCARRASSPWVPAPRCASSAWPSCW
ncbi:MAG: MFS transporter [Candidatus Moduliflexus flocculans]|nr:MFS transporter [Candidatus Moduliflexus flocculans]